MTNDKTSILTAKLAIPASAAGSLDLPRLLPMFQAALDRPVSFFVAGAGFGKTTNLSDFLRASNTRTVWLTLDVLDQEPARLLDYLLEGFRRSTGVESWAAAQRDRGSLPETMADLFINDLQERVVGRTVVVIDEFQQIAAENSGSALFVSRLLHYLPDNIRCWIVSRNEPRLLVQKLKSSGQLKVIGEEILAWGPDEILELSRQTGRELSEADAGSIAEMTGGRAATIRIVLENFAASRLSEQKVRELLRNPSLELRRYIEEEVIGTLPPALRSRLITLSVAEEVEVSALSEALEMPDLEDELYEIQRTSSLLRPSPTAGAFRLDPLVRSVLFRIARTELGAVKIKSMQRALAELYLRRKELLRAAPAFIEAGEPERAAEILSRHGAELLLDGKAGTIRQLASGLEADLLISDPARVHYVARAALHEGRFSEAADLYEALLKQKKLPPKLKAWALQGLCETAYRRNRMPAAREFQKKLAPLFDNAEPFCRVKMLNDFAILDLRSGLYDSARELWERALALSFDPQVPPEFQRIVLHNLGLPTAATGRIKAARSYFERLTAGDGESQKSQEAVGYLNLARIALMQGDLPTTERNLELALLVCDKFNLQTVRGDAMELFGDLFRRRGELNRALEALDTAAAIYAQAGVDPSMKDLVEQQALLELDRGNLDHSHSMITSLIQRRREAGNQLSLPAPLITAAKILQKLDQKESARTLLGEAATIAREWNMRYFLAEALLLLSQLHETRAIGEAMEKEAREIVAEEGYAFGSAQPSPTLVVEEENRSDLQAILFGAPNVRGDLGEASWPLRKALSIFCFLVTSPSYSASKDQLVDVFWGEDDLDVIERNFHPTISFLRKSVRAVTSAGKNFIQFTGGRYRLDPRFKYGFDTEIFSTSLAEYTRSLRTGAEEKALEQFDRALSVYSAPFMDGFYESWVIARRTQFSDSLRRAGLDVGAVLLARGRRQDVLTITRRLTEVDPLDESVGQLEMRAFAAQGDITAVKSSFDRLDQALRKELDQSTSARTRALLAELTR